MYLAVLASDRPSMPSRIEALVRTGRMDEALALLARHRPKPGAAVRRALSFLARHHPDAVGALIEEAYPDRFREFHFSCRLAAGAAADVAEAGLPAEGLLGVKAALILGRPAAAQARLHGFYRRYGLEPVEGLVSKDRLSLAAPRAPAAVEVNACPALISVILTARNEEDRLATAVASILAQTWRRLELLIVDDASSDATAEVAAAFARQDARVRLLRLDRHLGTWRAKNHALAAAQGDFVMMHDADDWSHPRKLEWQAASLLRDPNVKCVSSYWYRVHEDSGLPFAQALWPLLRWNPSSAMYRRRQVLGEIGGYRVGLLGGDCEFIARIETRWGAHSHRRLHVPLSLGAFRQGSLTSNPVSGTDVANWSEVRQRHWEAWRRWHVDWVRGRGSLFVGKADGLEDSLPPVPPSVRLRSRGRVQNGSGHLCGA